MIKPEEIRIGNYFYLTCEGHEDEPELIQWTLEDYEFYKDRMQDIKPIRLTEEWLLKFGFEKDAYDTDEFGDPVHTIDICLKGHDRIFIGKYPQDNWVSIRDGDTGDSLSNDIKHVHQLQNLYFALTSEELEINE